MILATKAKMANHMPLKAAVAPTSSKDDEDTASGFDFTIKKGRASRAISSIPSPSRGQTASNVALLPQPSRVLPTTPCLLEGGVLSSRRRGLWDQDVDITSYLKDSLLRPKDEERMGVHGGHHLLQEAMKQFGQTLATSCLASKKLRSQETIVKQEKQDTQQKMVSLQQEIQKASEPSIGKLSNSWMPRLRRSSSKRLAWQSKTTVCPTCNKSLSRRTSSLLIRSKSTKVKLPSSLGGRLVSNKPLVST